MRSSARFIDSKFFVGYCLAGMACLLLSACGVEPHSKQEALAELAKVKGPEVGGVESSLKLQAEQAVTLRDYRRAAQVYKQLSDKAPANADYQVGLAENLRKAGDNANSLHVLDALLAKDPHNVAGLENKGLALMNTGEFAEAGDVLGQVMKLEPKRWRTLNGIGILFAMKGKYDGAIAYFQEALGVSTDNASVLNNAALTYAINRQFDRSYASFARAKRHAEPGSIELKSLDLNLALVYAVDGKLDEAEQTAAPHLTKEALYNNMGFYSYLTKNNEMAKTYLNMALTHSPSYYERAWKNLGALTGDNSASQVERQAMPMGLDAPEAKGKLPEITAKPAPAAGVSLEDIPESKPLHSDAASPYAGMEAEEKPAAPVPAKPLEKAKKVVAKKPEIQAPAAEVVKTEAPLLNLPSQASDEDGQKQQAPGHNPDIVLLRKPQVPEHNGDWDAPPPPSPSAGKQSE